jgi:signal transduction histidine kinase/ligand-binding sensor domain-containing protein/CheY-like chemotaxis protein/HPt (histidine-containing phosphotransfer) domain-containing protein
MPRFPRCRQLSLALLLSLLSLGGAVSQQKTALPDDMAVFNILSLRDGLANPSVSAITQDSKGFIWLATQGGLCRYDGSSFRTFVNEPFNDDSISTDLIQTMFRDSDDTLWLGTYSGLNRFDSATERFIKYRYDENSPTSLSNDLVIAIARDARGRLWVGTLNGLNRLDESTGRFQRYFHDESDPHSIPNNVIRSLFLDSKGRLWVGTTGGALALYDYERDCFDNKTVASGGASGREGRGVPSSTSVQSIAEDSMGNLWLGAWGRGIVRYSPESDSSTTYSLPDNRIYVVNTQAAGRVLAGSWGGGLFSLETATGEVKAYRNSQAAGTLPNNVVYCIMYDSAKELWIGTNGGGLARLDHARNSFSAWVSDPSDPDSLPRGEIIASLVDRRGRLWASVYANGLQRFDEGTGKWRHYRHDDSRADSLGDDICNYLYEDSRGSLWVATNAGLSRYNEETDDFTTLRPVEGDPNSLSSGIIRCIAEDPKGNFWIGTYLTGMDYWERDGGIFRHYPYSPKDHSSLSDNLINAIAYDARGRLWVGTNNGLNLMDEGKFIRYYYDPENTRGLSNSAIARIFPDSEGIMWVATRGGGLDRFEPRTNSFTHFMRKEGLPNNIVNSVLEDRDGNLWIVTQTGIAIYDRKTGVIKPVSLYKGLENALFTSGSSKSPGGQFYFGSVGMLVKFDPERYARNTHVPPVFITELKAANRPRLATPVASSTVPLALKNWENSVEIRFAALDYCDPAANQFAYKLEGLDREWTYCSTRNFAIYTNLPGGRYLFRVKAANNDGLWNDWGASLPLVVERSPFSTPYAMAIYIAIFALTGFFVVRYRRNQRLAAEAKRVSEAKSEFVAMVSHEIRTPMNGVIGMAELLDRTELAPRQRDYVDAIKRSGKGLLELVNSVLDFSKLEAGRVELEDIPFDLEALLSSIRTFFAPEASGKGLDFDVIPAPDLPRWYRGDPLRLNQSLANLVANALKFTDHGAVRLYASKAGASDGGNTTPQGDSRLSLLFEVADTGIGIKEEELRRLFTPFTQADQSTARRYGGTGLGLAISKSYIELMGGSIEAISRFGSGSTFRIVLPLALSSERDFAAAEAARSVSQPPQGLRVLVVDDDPVNRRVALGFLEQLGARGVEAESGQAAVEALRQGAYDAVLLDCMMAGMDGYEAARQMRERSPGLAIIAMTAHSEASERARCVAAGMSGYLKKPFSIGDLAAALVDIASKGRPSPGIGLIKDAEEEPAELPIFDEASFDESYREHFELAEEIFDIFLKQSGELGAEARALAEKGEWPAVADIMHRFKGSSGVIGGKRVLRDAKALEASCRGAPGAEPLSEAPAMLVRFEADLSDLCAAMRGYLERKRPAK